MISQYGKESFIFEIRKVFSDVNLARSWENKVLKRIGAVKREDFINQTDNYSISPEAAAKGNRGKKGILSPLYGKKNPRTSLTNSLAIGEKNHMWGKTGDKAPNFGRVGELHPMFGKKHPAASLSCKTVVVCPHCKLIGQNGGMRRWHFNNCKHKQNN